VQINACFQKTIQTTRLIYAVKIYNQFNSLLISWWCKSAKGS